MWCSGFLTAGPGLTAAQHTRADQQHVQGLEREQLLLPGPGLRHVQAAVKVSELHAFAGMGVGAAGVGWDQQAGSALPRCWGARE